MVVFLSGIIDKFDEFTHTITLEVTVPAQLCASLRHISQLHAHCADIVIQGRQLLMISTQFCKTCICSKVTGMDNLLRQHPELLSGETTGGYLIVYRHYLVMTFSQPIKNRLVEGLDGETVFCPL
ncbi:hypothetical protein LVO39_005548 [Salmonella enterica]|nr:hypothetical protein [Salmonella enterica subsp. enterica serovar 4,[5],12:b:-]EIK1791260.1 hypothetical protein [Salmonella enterica]EIQ6929138.1 hypothetical protein [Salmonella enterica]EJA8584987.1 hypothetical protein [Salmonella enterica]HAG4669177.1 hypothetical protein [Salmonella enterica]